MFVNVLMLLGTGAAILPLVLHLLSRTRHRTVDWGAMMFLQPAQASQRRSRRLSQRLLLALRMALVLILALALARPVIRGGWSAAARTQPITCAIVLDVSGSMAYDEGGHTRFDLARAAALGIIGALRPGDRVSLVLMGAPQLPQEVIPTPDLRAVADRLWALGAGQGPADISDGLRRAAEILAQYEPVHRDIYLITDRQALSWKSVDDAFAAQWKQRVIRGGAPTRVFAMAVGNAQADNVVIERVALTNPPAIRSQPTEVEVRLHNRGGIRRAGLVTRLKLDEQTIFQTPVDLAPGQVANVRANLTFSRAGSQVLAAEIRTSGLSDDDRLMLAIDVVPPLRVLVLSGDEKPARFRGESDFLRLALAPFQTTRQFGLAATQPITQPATAASAPDAASVDVRPVEQSAQLDLGEYQVVVLANIERFEQILVRRLEQYVYGGGGLLVAPGNLSRVTEYNEWLYRGGAGILPAELSPATPGDGSQATTLLGYEPSHPVFRFVRGRPDPLPRATVGRYFPAAVHRPDSQILATYASGAPFLVETARWGQGRVLLMTTPLDADWSTLPLSNFYLPLMQSVVRYLSGGRRQDRNLSPGERLTYEFAAPAENRIAWLDLPNAAEPLRLPVLPYGAGELRYGQTRTPGVYRLRILENAQETAVNFVVQPPVQESDLTQLTEAEAASLADKLSLRRIDSAPRAVTATIARDRDGRDLWPFLLGLTLALSMLELALVRRRRGAA